MALAISGGLSKWTSDTVDAADDYFRTDDLNIHTLKTSGELDICWTDRLKDHLRLSLSGYIHDDVSESPSDPESDSESRHHYNRPMLEIYWFDFEKYAWLAR